MLHLYLQSRKTSAHQEGKGTARGQAESKRNRWTVRRDSAGRAVLHWRVCRRRAVEVGRQSTSERKRGRRRVKGETIRETSYSGDYYQRYGTGADECGDGPGGPAGLHLQVAVHDAAAVWRHQDIV